MSGTHQTFKARWRHEQAEYVGLTVGMLFAMGVPKAMQRQALSHVLLACWTSLKLGLIPESGLPTFYHDADSDRAMVHNWFILLVEAWMAVHMGRSFDGRQAGPAAVAHGLIKLIRDLPNEAREALQRQANLTSAN